MGFSDKCGRASFNFFTKHFDMDGFIKCLKSVEGKSMKVSNSCGRCVGESVKYGTDNCVTPCTLDTCSGGCRSCNEKSYKTLRECTGFQMPTLTCGNEPIPKDPVFEESPGCDTLSGEDQIECEKQFE